MTTRDQAIQDVCEILSQIQGFGSPFIDFKHAESARGKAIFNNAVLIIEKLEIEYGVEISHDN